METKAKKKLRKESNASGKLKYYDFNNVYKQQNQKQIFNPVKQMLKMLGSFLLGKYKLNVTNTAQIQPMNRNKVF